MIVPAALIYTAWGVIWATFLSFVPGVRVIIGPLDSICQSLLTPVSWMLVFRLGRSATRFWDARAALGKMVAKCREAASIAVAASGSCPQVRDSFCKWVSLFPVAVKNYLRPMAEEDRLRELCPLMKEHEAWALLNDRFPPLTVIAKLRENAFRMSSHVEAPPEVRAQVYNRLNVAINDMNDSWGAMERIINTPLPFVYVAYLRTCLLLYLFLRITTGVANQGWLVLPGMLAMTWALLGLEAAAVECERPFGRKPNHLRLGLMSRIVAENVAQMLYGPNLLAR